ncbi:MAG: methyltransferase domain-containing protein [Spirochaetales bacterium]|nr:methyltransferase domain-containing protein [Spirochaetales bacterium]
MAQSPQYDREPPAQERRNYTDRMNQAYTRFAGLYAWAVRSLPVWKTWLRAVLPHIVGPRVLEASFGTGYLLTQYADRFEVSGIDYNERMVLIAGRELERKGLQADLFQADVANLPFQESFFDCIVNTMAFSGYPDGNQAMSEFRRVLRNGGRLLILDFDFPENGNCAGWSLTRLMQRSGDIIRDLRPLLAQHGFAFENRVIGGFGSVQLFIAHRGRLRISPRAVHR